MTSTAIALPTGRFDPGAGYPIPREMNARDLLALDLPPDRLKANDLFVGVEDYLRDVPTDVPWLCEPLAYFGGVTLLAGIWKGGKSTFVCQLLRARETGEEFLGQTVPVGPALLVTEEGGIPVSRKLRGLKDLLILDKRAADFANLKFDELLETIESVCRTVDDPALVVIDTFAVWGDVDDENESVQITNAIRKIAVLAQETGAAIVLVDHVRKDGGDHGRAIRGSGAKPSTVDIYGVFDYGAVPGSTDRKLSMEGRVIDPIVLYLMYDALQRRYALRDGADLDPQQIEAWLYDVPPTGPGVPLKGLQGRWDLTPKPTRMRADSLVQSGYLRRLLGKVGNADGYLYWATFKLGEAATVRSDMSVVAATTGA